MPVMLHIPDKIHDVRKIDTAVIYVGNVAYARRDT